MWKFLSHFVNPILFHLPAVMAKTRNVHFKSNKRSSMHIGRKVELMYTRFERQSVNTKPKLRFSSAILDFPKLSPL